MTSKILPSAERVRELLHYEPETGVFTRLVTTRPRDKVGDVAGTPSSSGYQQIMVDGRLCKAHRLAWLHTYGVWPANHIDHIDRDPSNNRIDNLREATNAENLQNRVRARSDNTSGFLGAKRQGMRWEAKITVNGKSHYLGCFATAEAAHAEYLRAKQVLHPFNTLMADK